MKRKRVDVGKPPEAIPLDIKRDIPEKQLAAIGALALAYNEVEASIDRLFYGVVGLPEHLQLEIITRIGGIEGTVNIIKQAAKPYLSNKERQHLEEVLGDGCFMRLKSYRDCVIHARHINFVTGIGIKVDRQAKVFDVLVRQDALDAAFNILEALRHEFLIAFLFISTLMEIKRRGPDGLRIKQFEELAANFRAQFQQCQTVRLALPPLPEFPSESELREAGNRFQKHQLSKLMEYGR